MTGPVMRAGPRAVILPADLAVETLFKWFHLEDYRYEIQEQLTWTDPHEFAATVRSCLEDGEVSHEVFASAGFTERYQHWRVKATDLNGKPLGLPLPFVRVLGIRTVASKPSVTLKLSPDAGVAPMGDPAPIMDAERFKKLLKQSEGPKLDYKAAAYRLDDEGSKSAFIKDIVALANTNPPDQFGYIVIGVKEDTTIGRRELIGISAHPDDAELQQLVKDKISPVPDFAYAQFEFDGKQFGVIRVIPSRMLCQATRTFGVLRSHVVYTRKGSRNAEVLSEDMTELLIARANHFALPEIKSRADEIATTEREMKASKVLPSNSVDRGDHLLIRFHSRLNQKWKDPLGILESKIVESNQSSEPLTWPIYWRTDPEARFFRNYSALCIPSRSLRPEWHAPQFLLEGAYWGPVKAYAVDRFISQNKNREIEATILAIGRKDKPYLYLSCSDYDAYLQQAWSYYYALEIALRGAAIAVDPEISALPGQELRKYISEFLLPSGQLSRLIPDRQLRRTFDQQSDPEAVATALECLIQEAGSGRFPQ
jgi:hypothetical protein